MDEKLRRNYKRKYDLLNQKYVHIEQTNCRLLNRINLIRSEINQLKHLKGYLLERLDTHQDRFRDLSLEIPDEEPIRLDESIFKAVCLRADEHLRSGSTITFRDDLNGDDNNAFTHQFVNPSQRSQYRSIGVVPFHPDQPGSSSQAQQHNQQLQYHHHPASNFPLNHQYQPQNTQFVAPIPPIVQQQRPRYPASQPVQHAQWVVPQANHDESPLYHAQQLHGDGQRQHQSTSSLLGEHTMLMQSILDDALVEPTNHIHATNIPPAKLLGVIPASAPSLRRPLRGRGSRGPRGPRKQRGATGRGSNASSIRLPLTTNGPSSTIDSSPVVGASPESSSYGDGGGSVGTSTPTSPNHDMAAGQHSSISSSSGVRLRGQPNGRRRAGRKSRGVTPTRGHHPHINALGSSGLIRPPRQQQMTPYTDHSSHQLQYQQPPLGTPSLVSPTGMTSGGTQLYQHVWQYPPQHQQQQGQYYQDANPSPTVPLMARSYYVAPQQQQAQQNTMTSTYNSNQQQQSIFYPNGNFAPGSFAPQSQDVVITSNSLVSTIGATAAVQQAAGANHLSFLVPHNQAVQQHQQTASAVNEFPSLTVTASDFDPTSFDFFASALVSSDSSTGMMVEHPEPTLNNPTLISAQRDHLRDSPAVAPTPPGVDRAMSSGTGMQLQQRNTLTSPHSNLSSAGPSGSEASAHTTTGDVTGVSQSLVPNGSNGGGDQPLANSALTSTAEVERPPDGTSYQSILADLMATADSTDCNGELPFPRSLVSTSATQGDSTGRSVGKETVRTSPMLSGRLDAFSSKAASLMVNHSSLLKQHSSNNPVETNTTNETSSTTSNESANSLVMAMEHQSLQMTSPIDSTVTPTTQVELRATKAST